jgi:hypothetical protein
MVPMLTRLPEASIRWVPPVAPVLIPVVPLRVVPVIVLVVEIVPKPEAIDPEASAPTVVKDDVTTPEAKVVPVSDPAGAEPPILSDVAVPVRPVPAP